LKKKCSNNKGELDYNKFIHIVDQIYKDIRHGGDTSLKNKKRFINGMVGANLLYEIYQNNPKEFPRIYDEAMTSEHVEYEDFFKTIQEKVPVEVKTLPPGNQYLYSIKVNPSVLEKNRRAGLEQTVPKSKEKQRSDNEDQIINL
jgi:hypothetical protein